MQKEKGKKEPQKLSKKSGDKLILDLFGTEILERNASKFGTGAHVIIPKECIGKKIKIIIEEKGEK